MAKYWARIETFPDGGSEVSVDRSGQISDHFEVIAEIGADVGDVRAAAQQVLADHGYGSQYAPNWFWRERDTGVVVAEIRGR